MLVLRAAGRIAAGVAAFVVGGALVRLAAGRGNVVGPALILGAAVIPFLVLWAWNDPRIAIALVIATYPVPFALSAGGLQLQLVDIAVPFAVFAVAASRAARGVPPLRIPPVAWWLIALVLWCIVSTVFAVDQAWGLKGTASFIEAVAVLITTYTVIRSIRDVRWLLTVFVAVAAIVAVGTLSGLQQMSVGFGGASVQGRAEGLFQNSAVSQQLETLQDPNQFGAYMSAAFFAGLALLLSHRRTRSRVLTGIAMVPIAAALLASLSRGAWIGAAAGVVFLAVFAPASRSMLVRSLLAVAIVGGAILAVRPSAATAVRDRFDALTVRGPYDERPAMWREAIRQVAADPVTGSGPANYRVLAQRHGLGAFAPYHAHDFLLTWAAETGIPGVALLIAFAVAFGVRVASTVRRTPRSSRDRALVVALAGASVAFAVHGIVHYNSRHFDLYSLIAMTLAACALLDAGRRPRLAPTRGYTARSPVRTALPVQPAGREGSDRHAKHRRIATLDRA